MSYSICLTRVLVICLSFGIYCWCISSCQSLSRYQGVFHLAAGQCSSIPCQIDNRAVTLRDTWYHLGNSPDLNQADYKILAVMQQHGLPDESSRCGWSATVIDECLTLAQPWTIHDLIVNWSAMCTSQIESIHTGTFQERSGHFDLHINLQHVCIEKWGISIPGECLP